MQVSDFRLIDPRSSGLVRKILAQWNPELEARAIELLNTGMAQSDVSRTLEREGLVELATSKSRTKTGGTGALKKDHRGINAVYQKLLDEGKLDPSIKELNKALTGKYKTAAEIAAQDRQILDHYLLGEETFKGKPGARIAKSFNAKYNLTSGTNLQKGEAVSPRTVVRALENAIAGKYPEYDEKFKARALDEFIVSRHANIFPQVKKLDEVIKAAVKKGYLVDEGVAVSSRMDRLRKEYAKAIGMALDSPELENNFISRFRKILNSYAGNNIERYEVKLYNTLKAPISNYIDSPLQKNLLALGSHAGKLSNKDMALGLGLPREDAYLLDRLGKASSKIYMKYGFSPIIKGGRKIYMAGDHTDSKGIMKSLPGYKKEFMRIAFIQEGLNTVKAGYDQKIHALRRLAEEGHIFDRGRKTGAQKGTLYGGYYSGPFSGPLTEAEKAAGGRTIPAAIKKLQQEFSELSGGYKLGGFDIKKAGGFGAANIKMQEFLQPRINQRTSPIAMTLRETLNNLRYGTKDMKTVARDYLNVVDRAIVGPEGATTKGRIDIIKRFGPQDLKGSGYLEGLRTAGPKGTSPQVTALMKKGYSAAIAAADLNEGDICRILGMKRGGLAGGGCGTQMRRALQEAPEETMTKIAEVGSSKLKTAARGFLGALGKFGPAAGKYGMIAAAGAAGAGLVKTFMNDDPTTYLSDENQQKNMLISMVTNPIDETPEESPAILDWQLPTLGAVTAAGMVPGGKRLYDVRRRGGVFPTAQGTKVLKPAGPVRSALSPLRGVLGKGLAATATPLGLAALEPLHIAGQIQSGDSLTDVATNPWNYLGPTFASGLTKEATRFASPMASKIMRMGLSPTALRGLSRFGGYGLAASLGIQGLQKFSDWRNKRGWFSDD